MEFPLYFSLLNAPGYDWDTLQTLGVTKGISELFLGRSEGGGEEVSFLWGTESHSIESKKVLFS